MWPARYGDSLVGPLVCVRSVAGPFVFIRSAFAPLSVPFVVSRKHLCEQAQMTVKSFEPTDKGVSVGLVCVF